MKTKKKLNLDDLDFSEIHIKSKKVKGLSICLGWDCMEGKDGEFDDNDPNDLPLLRFDILQNGEQLDNGSYCTQLSATDKRPLLVKAAEIILEEAEDALSEGGFKRRMAECSWLGINWKGKIIPIGL